MLSDYLSAFTTASKSARGTLYLDLFAGQAANVSRDTGRPIEGSLLRALGTSPPFTALRGFELNRTRARSLEENLRTRFPGRDVVVHAGDVHDALRPALDLLPTYRLAPTFAFIDPDGIEARWDLLETLAAYKTVPNKKVELFLLLASPQVGRVVNDRLDQTHLAQAEQQVTALFGSQGWRPILDARRSGVLDPEQTRDELTNLMRWRLEKALGYAFTHTLRLTNVHGVPIYDMVFATDHPVGNKIMKSIYGTAAKRFPQMREEARARQRDRHERDTGAITLFPHIDLVQDTPLAAHEAYQHTPPIPPYGSLDP